VIDGRETPPAKPPTVLAVDVGGWPIVQLVYSGTPSDSDVAAHLVEIEEKVLGRRQPFVHVIDQRRGSMPDAIQRALIADHQRRMEDAYRTYCRGEVYIVSKQTRQAMTAIFWLAPPPYPYAFVETVPEAFDWARERVAGG
jgi:hypothetical protein